MTIRPDRALNIASAARFVQWNTPSASTSCTRRQSAVFIVRRSPSLTIPALLTSTSSRPWRVRTSSNIAATRASSDTSHATASARPPAASMAETTVFASASPFA